MSRHRGQGQSRGPLIQVDITVEVTLTLPRQIVWLLAGIAISYLHTFGGMVEKIGHVLRVMAG